MIRLKPFLFALLFILLGGITVFAVVQKFMSVQVKTGQVRSAPSFTGMIIQKLSYGEQVAVSEEKSSWVKVSMADKNTEGWMHSSALTHKKIVLKPGASDVEKTASGDEVALAGKGFNEEVEKNYRTGNKNLDYEGVDKMEKIVVSQPEIEKFLNEGGLTPEGGVK
jgi:hypothetical protein